MLNISAIDVYTEFHHLQMTGKILHTVILMSSV